MENVLNMVRKGTLTVTTTVIDALLHGLDGLRTLKEEIVSSEDSGLDIAPTVAELNRAADIQEEQQEGSQAETSQASTTLTLDQAATTRLQEALAAERNVYRIKVVLDRETLLAAVRCFQILTELSQIGDVLVSLPTLEEIKQEKAGVELELVLTSHHNEEIIRDTVKSVPDIENVDIGPYRLEEATPTPSARPPSDAVPSPKSRQVAQTVRIDVERLDNMMNTIGELVIERTRIMQISKALDSRYQEDEWVAALESTSAHTARLIGEIQEEIMKARMLPIGTVFSGFPRMIRDLAQKSDKRLEFQMDGQDTEIDRTVVERIRDPLVHLLRNAVDHGIEPPEARKTAGKPEKAMLRLSAHHEQNQIVISVADDGQGIDTAKVRESSVKKGLISAEVAARMSDAEALDLIFMAGVSTTEKATEVSGRGVGMDIVKTNIEAIHGFVTVDTKVGQGTTFTLKLPLTLATIPGLLVTLSDALYAIPLVYVLETLKIDPGSIHTVGGGEVIRHREGVLPLLNLSTVLGMSANGRGHDRSSYTVVVRSGERTVGLAVDSLMEPQEIVVKSLGKYFGDVQGISGASVLGDGRVVLILDMATLINSAVARVP